MFTRSNAFQVGLLAVVVAGAIQLGDAIAANCTKRCKQVSAVEVYKSPPGVWTCTYIVNNAGTICAGVKGHVEDVFTDNGASNQECVTQAGSADGDVKYKSCEGDDTCSTNCAGQNNTDKVEATKNNDGANCGMIANRKLMDCKGE